MGNVFEEYARLNAEISALEAKKEQLRPHIVNMMIERGEKKIETDLGNFSLGVTKTWTYPEAISEMADQLKAAKSKAESTGEATCEEKPRLTFTAVKL